MATSPTPDERLADLRRRAAARLSGSSTSAPPFVASDALAVLHDLASSPDTAADALALLHELQVHQVELELQAEELRESRAELEAMLHRQLHLYDHLPVGCFTIDRQLVVHELNRRGAALLGLPREEARGLRLDAFLSSADSQRLRAMLDGAEPAVLELRPRRGRACPLRAELGVDPAAERFYLTLSGAA